MPRPPPQHMVMSACSAVAALELVDGLGDEDGARPPEGVADGDRATVGVHPGAVGPQLPLPGQHHRGERLVDLEDVDVVDRELVVVEQLLGGGDRARQHQHRIGADEADVDDAWPGASSPSASAFSAGHQQQGAGAVGDLRRRAGRVDAVGAAGRLQRAPAPSRVVSRRPSSRATRWVVPVGLPSSPTSGASMGEDLAAVAVLGPGLGGAVLRQLAELVAVGPGDSPLLGDALGALELAW